MYVLPASAREHKRRKISTMLQQTRVFLLSSGKGFFHFINYDLIHIVDSPSNLILIVKFENHRNIHEKIEPQINIDERRFAAAHPLKICVHLRLIYYGNLRIMLYNLSTLFLFDSNNTTK